jgi:hypothetical protein
LTDTDKAKRIDAAFANLAADYERAGRREASFAIFDLIIFAPAATKAALYDAIKED